MYRKSQGLINIFISFTWTRNTYSAAEGKSQLKEADSIISLWKGLLHPWTILHLYTREWKKGKNIFLECPEMYCLGVFSISTFLCCYHKMQHDRSRSFSWEGMRQKHPFETDTLTWADFSYFPQIICIHVCYLRRKLMCIFFPGKKPCLLVLTADLQCMYVASKESQSLRIWTAEEYHKKCLFTKTTWLRTRGSSWGNKIK